MGQTMTHGYYYSQVINGEGWTVTAECDESAYMSTLTFYRVTKASTRDLKRQLKADGFTESQIDIEKG